MSSAHISFLIIAIIVGFWIYIVLKITLVRYFKLRRESDDSEKGQPVQGTVISAHKTGRGKFQAVRLKVEFPNFSQVPIQEEFRFVDSKPEENRYEEGRRVMLLIDRDAPDGPKVRLSGGKTMIGRSFLLISAVLLSLTFYGSWYLYKLTYAKINGNFNELDKLFEKNDSMPLLGIIFIAVLIFQWFLFRFLKNLTSTKKNVSDKDLKYFGEKTTAFINRYEDTGVSVNDNPKVKFYYTFTDRNGTTHSGEDSVILGKLQIGLLPSMKEKEIFFMPQAPENSKFTENLSPQSLAGCLQTVLIFQALIFSGIILGIYISSL